MTNVFFHIYIWHWDDDDLNNIFLSLSLHQKVAQLDTFCRNIFTRRIFDTHIFYPPKFFVSQRIFKWNFKLIYLVWNCPIKFVSFWFVESFVYMQFFLFFFVLDSVRQECCSFFFFFLFIFTFFFFFSF